MTTYNGHSSVEATQSCMDFVLLQPSILYIEMRWGYIYNIVNLYKEGGAEVWHGFTTKAFIFN